jgi:hypothetical protein
MPRFAPEENVSFPEADLLTPVARSLAVDFAVRLAAAQVAFGATPILDHLRAWSTEDSLFQTIAAPPGLG